MKGRILPLDEVAEFGKATSVVLSLVMTAQEAQKILGDLADPTGLEKESLPVQLLFGYLRVIAGGDVGTTEETQDAVNTDGRSLGKPKRSKYDVMIDPPQPRVMVVTDHGPICNCEYHRGQ